MTSLTTHFRTMLVKDMSLDPPAEIEVSEPVEPGRQLVSMPDPGARREETVRPVVGENTRLSQDECGIEASCHGYPTITLETTERGQTALVSVVPLIRVGAELLEAKLTLHPPVPPSEQLSAQTIAGLLDAAGVKYGVDLGAIEAALSRVAETGLPVSDWIIARAKAALPGQDARLRFEVEVGAQPGKLLSDGSIDFRERNMFVPVSANQIIARKTAATAGIPGLNLAGDLLEARDGKDIQVKVSEDAAFSEEDGTVRATAAGVLTVVGDNSIRVCAQHRIDGDVDYSTGNIRSHDAVEISGSILPDFMVSTRGDLLVGGNIQAATVNSHGNIVVKGGILGPTSTIKVQGDADIHYIERSLLQAGGNVVIRSSSYYSTITAAGAVLGDDKVKLVGGRIVAGHSITAGRIGSSASDPISVAAGVDARRFRRYRELQDRYQQILEETRKWYNRHGRHRKDKGIEALEEQMAGIEQEVGRMNLIPGTPEDSLGAPDCFYTDATITISTRIAAGTIIRLGNETTVIKRDLGRSRIQLDRDTGAINITSF